jgi:Mrp family chromosome partitioning ATPase
MERIKRALELARQERSQAALAGQTPPDLEPLDATASVTASGTLIRPRELPVEPAVLKENRLLMPGMIGDAAAGFRLLRTRVIQQMRARNWNTLAIVSATPDEGKTFTAINLAIAISATRDSSALLVDLDLRFPRIYRRFGFVPHVGIEDCLRGEAAVAEALVAPQGYPGLLLLPARGPVDHSSELIGGASARKVFTELKERYSNRIVVYDLPPVLAADDAVTFAPHVDAALLVVGDGRVQRQDLTRSIELLRGVPILGTVLNGSRTERSAEYAY